MKRFVNTIPPFFRNFYILVITFFLVWMLFFDSNDIISQIKLNNKLNDLEETRQFYEDQIVQVKNDREALMSDQELLEKLAREKYLMKKENEDLFIVVEE